MTVQNDIAAFYRALSAGQVVRGITEAITACDPEAVVTLLEVLAVKDPAMARAVQESMLAILSSAPGSRDPGRRLTA